MVEGLKAAALSFDEGPAVLACCADEAMADAER